MNVFELLTRAKNLWNRMPEQVKRLSVVLIVLLCVFIPARRLVIPRDFGEHGHYRASAVQANASRDTHYAGHDACNDCHDDIVLTKAAGYHKNVACEVCHGPSALHAEDPETVIPPAPRERGRCPLCHEYLASRPTGFPQIVVASHNPLKPCISCHNPHDPVPPHTPQECAACHGEIARTKAVSPHVYVDCTRCHVVPEEHKISPRQYRPSKPQTREFCGECHSKDSTESPDALKISMADHEPTYVCWQCHYPHLPEAR